MIAKFKDEFEAHMESARVRRGLNGAAQRGGL
jgi:DNA invertase Pin-like site-specific DNA recombinase